MSKENEQLIRTAYEALARGDVRTMLALVDPEMEWTYLDPNHENPAPQVCAGRHELEHALRYLADNGLQPQLEEVAAQRDQVMAVVRIPGIDAQQQMQKDDRRFAVLSVRDGRIVALRDCRDRQEAMEVAGLS